MSTGFEKAVMFRLGSNGWAEDFVQNLLTLVPEDFPKHSAVLESLISMAYEKSNEGGGEVEAD